MSSSEETNGKFDIKMFFKKNIPDILIVVRIVFFFLIILLVENSLFNIFEVSFLGKLFFSITTSGYIADILFILSSCFIIGYAFKLGYNRYQLSTGYSTSLILFVFYYFSFRFFPVLHPKLEYDFIPFKLCENLKLLDSLFMAFAIGYFIYTLIKSWKEIEKFQKTKTTTSDVFLNDNPILSDEKDLYGYTILAEQIVKKILNQPKNPNSFTLGINGQWGIGKSSLLNLITNRLDEKSIQKESDHILIKFSPLLLSNSNNLTIELLHQVNSKLSSFSIKSNLQFRKYIFFLTSKVSDLLSGIISIFSGEQSSKEQAELLSKTIKKIDRKVIITIDDLDRIEKDEIIEILKLIRNIGNLPNLVYLIAYDKGYLCKKLEDKDANVAGLFLEKFFTVDITLPKIKSEILRRNLIEEINNRIPYLSHEINQSFNIFEGKSIYSNIIDAKTVPLGLFESVVKTRRDMVRFINSLLLIPESFFYELVGAEILIVELFKLRFTLVYQSIRDKSILENSFEYPGYILNKKKANTFVKDIYPENEEVINNSLMILFGTKSTAEKIPDSKSIVMKERFDIYFNYLDETFVHFSEIDALRNENDEQL